MLGLVSITARSALPPRPTVPKSTRAVETPVLVCALTVALTKIRTTRKIENRDVKPRLTLKLIFLVDCSFFTIPLTPCVLKRIGSFAIAPNSKHGGWSLKSYA